MDRVLEMMMNNARKAGTEEMKRLTDLLDEAGIPYETRVNILGGIGLRYYGPDQGGHCTADIISDGHGREAGLLECQGLGWDCEGYLRAETVFEAIRKDFVSKGGVIRKNTMLVIYDWQKTAVITDIDLEHLESIKKIQIDCITGDEIAVVTYKDGSETVIDSAESGTRMSAFYDGSAVIYDSEKGISLIEDGKLIRPLILEEIEDHYEAESRPAEEMSEAEKRAQAMSRKADEMLKSGRTGSDALAQLLEMLSMSGDPDEGIGEDETDFMS